MNKIRFFGEYTFETAPMVLMRGIDIIDLPPRQLETLSVLLDAQGEVVSRERFLEIVWKGVVVEEHNLTQTIFLLRRALGKLPDGREYIETVPRIGYRLAIAAETHPDVDAVAGTALHSQKQMMTYAVTIAGPPKINATNLLLIAVCLALMMAAIAAIELLHQQPRLLSVQRDARGTNYIQYGV